MNLSYLKESVIKQPVTFTLKQKFCHVKSFILVSIYTNVVPRTAFYTEMQFNKGNNTKQYSDKAN